MARRKKSKKAAPRRRRRVSGVGKMDVGGMIMNVAGVAIGTVVASIVIKKALASQSEMIQGAVAIVAGAAIPMLVKNDIAKSAGYGMMAVGVTKLLAKMNIAGVGDADEYTVSVSGDDLSVLAGGDEDGFAMAGDDDGYGNFLSGDMLSVLAGIGEDEADD